MAEAEATGDPRAPTATAAAPDAATDSPPSKRAKVESSAASGTGDAPGAREEEEGTELRWEVRGGGGRGRPGRKGSGNKFLDPVVPVTDEAILGPVKDFYGLAETFPLRTHVVTRCMDSAERPKRCYYVSDAVRRLLMLDESESLTVIQVGLKVRPAALLYATWPDALVRCSRTARFLANLPLCSDGRACEPKSEQRVLDCMQPTCA